MATTAVPDDSLLVLVPVSYYNMLCDLAINARSHGIELAQKVTRKALDHWVKKTHPGYYVSWVEDVTAVEAREYSHKKGKIIPPGLYVLLTPTDSLPYEDIKGLIETALFIENTSTMSTDITIINTGQVSLSVTAEMREQALYYEIWEKEEQPPLLIVTTESSMEKLAALLNSAEIKAVEDSVPDTPVVSTPEDTTEDMKAKALGFAQLLGKTMDKHKGVEVDRLGRDHFVLLDPSLQTAPEDNRYSIHLPGYNAQFTLHALIQLQQRIEAALKHLITH